MKAWRLGIRLRKRTGGRPMEEKPIPTINAEPEEDSNVVSFEES
jgi:hypothetical protein